MKPGGRVRYTQMQIAVEAGTSQPTVGRWLDGESMPNGHELGRLADFFGVTTDYLLGREKATARPVNYQPSDTIVEDCLADLREVSELVKGLEMRMRKIKH